MSQKDKPTDALVDFIIENQLTPDELLGKPYKPSWGCVLYIVLAAGLCLFFLGVTIYTPINMLINGASILNALGVFAFLCFGDLVVIGPAAYNGYTAYCELKVLRYLADRNIMRYQLTNNPEQIIGNLPTNLRKLAKRIVVVDMQEKQSRAHAKARDADRQALKNFGKGL